MSRMPLPVTLTTTSLLALLSLVLALRVSFGRARYQISMGDGGNPDMLARLRTHANFTEYVPLVLILMALVESAGGDRTILGWSGAALVLFRLLHAVGLRGQAPNLFRAAGAGGTMLLTIGLAIYGLVLSTRA